MFGLQTVSCLHEIPVVRSSTTKLQDAYYKAKDTSVLIRFSCNMIETVASKALQIASTVAGPVIRPLSKEVNAIDKYAADRIRQIEHRYPVINTSTEDAINTLNIKTKSVRNAVTSVTDTTTSKIQNGRQITYQTARTVRNKACRLVDPAISYCQTSFSKIQQHYACRRNALKSRMSETIDSLGRLLFQSVEGISLWLRILLVDGLLRMKHMNDVLLTKAQQRSHLTALPQRLLILFGTFLENMVRRIKPNNSLTTEWGTTEFNSPMKYVVDRPYAKSDENTTIRRYISDHQPETDAYIMNQTNACEKKNTLNDSPIQSELDGARKSARVLSNIEDAEEAEPDEQLLERVLGEDKLNVDYDSHE